MGAGQPDRDPGVESALDAALNRIPGPVVHEAPAGASGEDPRGAAERYAVLSKEKQTGQWFAALVSLDPVSLNAIEGRFATRRGFFDFLEERNPLVEVWAWRTDGGTEDGVPGKRLTADQLARIQSETPDMPTFVTLAFRSGDGGDGPVRRYRMEFGFQAADEALVRTLAYEKSRRLQSMGRRILSTRDSRGRMDARSQWEALEEARLAGTFDLAVPVARPAGDTNLFVAFEYAVDDGGNLSRPLVAYREDDLEREVVDGQIRLRLRQPDGGVVIARAFRRVGLGDAMEPALNPVGSRDFVELRLEDPLERDPRRWNLLEFGEPDVLQQLALARFGLINAHIDRRIKILGIKRANLDMFVQPVVAGLNIGGGVSGVGFPIGTAVQLGYNVVAGPRFLPKVPSPAEMRELFLLLAARKQDPELRHKPDDLLDHKDLATLRVAMERLTDEQVQDTLEALDDADLRAMLAIARLAGLDAKYSLFVNILSGAAIVSGQAYSGAMREIFNNPYYSLNGDIYINYIMAAALGNKLVTPAGGASLYSLARGNAPAQAWLQYLGISFDLRALMNSVSRLRFRSLADKELRMPFPYAARMNDLAAYEIRIFGYPILLFYKRGLLKDDLQAYDNDYAYGLIGRRIAVHFPTKESMEAEIVAGRMVPLGYVKVSDGKGGTRDSNLAVFAYRIPDGPDAGQIAMILYGLKAYSDYSAMVERQVARLREFERGLEEGLVIEQVIDVESGTAVSSESREPRLHVGEAALAERYTEVLAPLMEWRRLLRRRELGLAETTSGPESEEALRRRLAALSIPVTADGTDPLLSVAPDGSRFRYLTVVEGRRQVVERIAIAGQSAVHRDVEWARTASAIESARKAAVAPGGSGVAFLNRVREVDGVPVLGPLLASGQGRVLGTGVRTGEAELESLFQAIDALPLIERLRIQRRHYAGFPLRLDADGDGHEETVAVTLEFPVGEVRHRRINPVTGQPEIEVYVNGELRELISAGGWVEISRDDAGTESATRTWQNAGTLESPVRGRLLEQTRTVEVWKESAEAVDPARPRMARLRLNRVTGDWTREVFGGYPQPLETASESGVSTNAFDVLGNVVGNVVFANQGAAPADGGIPPASVLAPVRGEVRFEDQVALERDGDVRVRLERLDRLTGRRTIRRLDPVRWGRLVSEETVDPMPGNGGEFRSVTELEYDPGFLSGVVPRRLVTRTPSGLVTVQSETLAVDPLSRTRRVVEREAGGVVRTNQFDARWDQPVRIETAQRVTVRRLDSTGTRVEGTTSARESGEELSRFEGSWDSERRAWRVRTDWWFRPGITNRTEMAEYSPGGRWIRTRVGGVLETRASFDADGILRGTATWHASQPGGAFDLRVAEEDALVWRDGFRESRVRTWVDGQPHDVFRTVRDPEGRLVEDGRREWPGLSLNTRVEYQGGTDRVLVAREFQNGALRRERVPVAEPQRTNDAWLLPVRVTPAWGLVSTQWMELGDPLGRWRETRVEDGRSSRVTEWFAGTALARRTESQDRSGRVVERSALVVAGDEFQGVVSDRVDRARVPAWSTGGTSGEASLGSQWFARGSDVLLAADTAEGRTHFSRSGPVAFPEFTVDPSARMGVPVRVGGRVENHVVSVARGRPPIVTTNGEPRQVIEVVGLLPLFQPIRTVEQWDRSGNLVETEVSRLPLPGAGGFVAEALFASESVPGDRIQRRFQFLPGDWTEKRPGNPGNDIREFVPGPPAFAPGPEAINISPWRDRPTSAETWRVSATGTAPRLVEQAGEPQEWRVNGYLPDEPGPWAVWTVRELDAQGKSAFESREIFDAMGRLTVRRISKRTSSGEPAIKMVYQIPSPSGTNWQALEPAPSGWRRTLHDGSPAWGPEASFLYFHLRSTNAGSVRLRIAGRGGREVVVQEAGDPRVGIRFWPLSTMVTQWRPDDADPHQADTVAGPLHAGPGVRTLVVSLAEVAQAGVEPSEIGRMELESENGGEVGLLRRLQRDDDVDRLRGRATYVRESQAGPHDFERFTRTLIRRRPSAVEAGEDVQTLVMRNGRPLAVTVQPRRRSPFPDVVVMSTDETGTPLPLYQLSSKDGHFEQRFEIVPQGEIVQVYSVVEGFELPRFEVHRAAVLGDELSPGFVAYGYDYHARVTLAKGAGWLARPLSVVRNRIAANPFSYAGERLFERWFGVSGPLASRFDYGALHNARVQAAAIRQLPMLADALLPARPLPWEGTPAPSTGGPVLDTTQVATALRELHVSRFGTNLTRSEAGTYLIPTSPGTVAERFVDTVDEADVIRLAVKVGEPGVARDLLEFYWEKTGGGSEPVQSSYDGLSGTALARELAFSRPVLARPTAAAQIAVANAALDLAEVSGEIRWEEFARSLASSLLERFRGSVLSGEPRGISERESLPLSRTLGLVFWPEAARFLVEDNVGAHELLLRLTRSRPLSPPDPEWLASMNAAREEQHQWLETLVLPEVERLGVVPAGWFEVQDIYGRSRAMAPERWTSPAGWLAWLEVSEQFGVEPDRARRWLENLARVHGADLAGTGGLDWSLPLLRSEAVSPQLTARFARVAGKLGHDAAAAWARGSLLRMQTGGYYPTAVTAGQATRPLKLEQGEVVYPRTDGQGWPRTFGVERELTANRPAVAAGNPSRPKVDERAGLRPGRTDLAVFVVLAALFYVGLMLVTLVWWRFRRLRRRVPTEEENPLLVPESVQQKAEERWSTRVLGMQSPAGAAGTRFSNATVEQNFLMSLRTIYKLVLEWRRRENGWEVNDPRLVEDGTDHWLNGMDEFASVVGIYLRHVIKAGAKDGFDREDPFEGNEDSNHIWSRLVMYLSEHYWVLVTLMRRYDALPDERERALFEWEFTRELIALGVRGRPEPFDARTLFNYPANPEAFDLMVIQRPGATLSGVMQQAAAKLQIPLSHLMRVVENYREWKRRESPFPIHPYLIEAAKIAPHFVLTALGALVWYNHSVGDSPIMPYLWAQGVAFALDPASLAWAVPLFLGMLLTGVAGFVRNYRFHDSLLERDRRTFLLDATVTSIFRRTQGEGPARMGWQWNPNLYQRASWLCRMAGWSVLGLTLFRLETPSFSTFLVVKGVLAMLAMVEVLGLLLPLAGTAISMVLQDYVTNHPGCGTTMRFLNRLNITATRPASVLWLSFRYYLRPSLPTGDAASRLHSILFYLGFNAVFFLAGAFLCQQILPLWFTETYLNASPAKLFVGGLVFWNTLYLLRYGLFLLATAVASGFATFPLRTFAVLAIGAGIGIRLMPGSPLAASPRGPLWLWGAGLVVVLLALAEERILAAWRRRRSLRAAPRNPGPESEPRPDAGLAIVYMSGDDLSHLKLTPALLMTRWRIMRDQLGSEGLRLLHRMSGEWTEADLERRFGQLYDLEKRSGVTLWNPLQLVVRGQPVPEGLDGDLQLAVDSEAERQELLVTWDIRRWLVTMMSTAGHSQDTAINLVDVALRLKREGLIPRTTFYFIQNKYDNLENNRPVQLNYTSGELGHRDRLVRLLRWIAPGCRAWSLQNWTPFGFKSAGMTGMDLVPEETLRLGTMVVLDRNATVHDLDSFMEDLRDAMADPNLIIVIPGRGTTNTLTDLGQGSQLVEEGHRSFLRGVMGFLGGRAGESVGTGWGNMVTVNYGRVQSAMLRPLTLRMPLTSRMQRGTSFAARTEGLIGFTPHAVGISEDTWAVSQAAHDAAALGGRIRFAVSRAMWHKVRETWSQAEWLAAFPRWSGGYLQMMHDPIMQQINEFGPWSIFAKELRSNSGRNFLAAPFALLNALLLPLTIILDVTPFIQILMFLWNFGFVMNQVLTLHGLNTYLEATGFHRGPAVLGTLAFALVSWAIPALRPMTPVFAVAGCLYGGFVVGLNRWLVTRVRDVVLFGPQLVLHALGQLMRQSIEFVASGAAATDAEGVNMAFRAAAGPREDRPLDRFPHFINLRTVVWIFGVPSIVLNLVALANLDMFNVLLLLPSLLFSVSLVAGPYLSRPRRGRDPGWRVVLPKVLGWASAFVFLVVVSLLVARGGWRQTLGFVMFGAVFGTLLWEGGRYLTFRWRWDRKVAGLRRRLAAAGVPGQDLEKTVTQVLGAGADAGKLGSALGAAGVPAAAQDALVEFVRRRMDPFLREPGQSRFPARRLWSEYRRSTVLALFVLVWFMVVPVPGLFVFTAGEYKTSMSLALILGGLGTAVGCVLVGVLLGRLVMWDARRGRGAVGLEARSLRAAATLRERMAVPGALSPEESSRLLALFMDLKTYLDQRSDAYMARTLAQIEAAMGSGGREPRDGDRT